LLLLARKLQECVLMGFGKAVSFRNRPWLVRAREEWSLIKANRLTEKCLPTLQVDTGLAGAQKCPFKLLYISRYRFGYDLEMCPAHRPYDLSASSDRMPFHLSPQRRERGSQIRSRRIRV
jgi:hypothetical protein